ncbi:MAG: CpsB/CapC family capsule biosynthesis tyrosine phosphatase [Ruminococcus sp.]
MKILDFHSHILPNIDDGSDSVETSLNMISTMHNQGVNAVVATPHFYAHRDRVDSFIQRRKSSFELLEKSLPGNCPHIILGAEVAYFRGISSAEEVKKLTIEKTGILLLEMPFQKWNDEIIGEVKHLVNFRKFTVMIAHLDRYLDIKDNKPFVKKLLSLPVIIQLNASALFDRKRMKKSVRLAEKQDRVVLGSDAHNMNSRPPLLGDARTVLSEHCKPCILDKIDKLGENLLGGNKIV